MKKIRFVSCSVAVLILVFFQVALAETGAEVPNLDLITIEGQPWRLSDYKGRVVLINFFATWCGPCRKEVPDLVNLHNNLRSKGFSAVGLAVGSDPEGVAKFAAKYGINYPVAMYGKDEVEKYGTVSAVPTTFLVDRQGMIAGGAEGLLDKDSLEKKILELLGRPDGGQ